MRKSVIVVLVIAVVVLGIGLVVMDASPKSPTSQPAGDDPRGSTTSTEVSSAGAINIKNNIFSPSQINVAKGGTVVWTNNDTTDHTVTIDNGDGPKSEAIKPGATYEYTFTEARSYQYHCTFHTSMRGTIVVKE